MRTTITRRLAAALTTAALAAGLTVPLAAGPAGATVTESGDSWCVSGYFQDNPDGRILARHYDGVPGDAKQLCSDDISTWRTWNRARVERALLRGADPAGGYLFEAGPPTEATELPFCDPGQVPIDEDGVPVCDPPAAEPDPPADGIETWCVLGGVVLSTPEGQELAAALGVATGARVTVCDNTEGLPAGFTYTQAVAGLVPPFVSPCRPGAGLTAWKQQGAALPDLTYLTPYAPPEGSPTGRTYRSGDNAGQVIPGEWVDVEVPLADTCDTGIYAWANTGGHWPWEMGLHLEFADDLSYGKPSTSLRSQSMGTWEWVQLVVNDDGYYRFPDTLPEPDPQPPSGQPIDFDGRQQLPPGSSNLQG